MELQYKDAFDFYDSNNITVDGNIIWLDEYKIEIIWTQGSHTVNVYDRSYGRKNTDCFSIGDFSKNGATYKEFLDSTVDYIKDNILEKI